MIREPLTSSERRSLRLAVDHQRRRRLGGHWTTSCGGCDMPLDDLTPGCPACWDRHRSRARRNADPERAAESRRLMALVHHTAEQLQHDRARDYMRAYNAERALRAER